MLKKSLLALLMAFALHANAQWTQLPLDQQNYTSIYFPSAAIGYIGVYIENEQPKILKTADAGLTWTEIPIPETGNNSRINTIHFLDETNGFLTTNGTVTNLKTTDGGQTWQTNSPFQFSPWAYFKNDGTGFLYSGVNYESNFSFTENFGVDWTIQEEPFNDLFDIHFPNDSGLTGYAISEYNIYKTTNGGITWASVAFNSFMLRNIYFINADIGFISGEPGMQKTTDGGLTWTMLDSGLLSDKVRFVSENTGFYNLTDFGAGPNFVFKTTNQGESWSLMDVEDDGITGDFTDMVFPENTYGYAISTDGHLYKLDVAAAIDNKEKNIVSVYPVPATNVLNVSNSFELLNTNYKIADLTGKIVGSGKISNSRIDISQLANGIYILALGDNKTVKFIKQ